MGGKVSSKMAAVGRVVQAVRPHTPLIKFPDRHGVPKPNVSEALKTLLASSPSPSPVTAAAAAAAPPPPIARPPGPITLLPGSPDSLATVQELPQRYRRRPLTLEEMNYIQRGGPE